MRRLGRFDMRPSRCSRSCCCRWRPAPRTRRWRSGSTWPRADQYVKENKLAEAVIEYRNAINLDARYGEARYKLAEVYERQDDAQNAFNEFIRAADLLPDRDDVPGQGRQVSPSGRPLRGCQAYRRGARRRRTPRTSTRRSSWPTRWRTSRTCLRPSRSWSRQSRTIPRASTRTSGWPAYQVDEQEPRRRP